MAVTANWEGVGKGQTSPFTSPCDAEAGAFEPTRISDDFGVLTVDAHGGWAYRMAFSGCHPEASAEVLMRDYIVPMRDGSSTTLTLPVGTIEMPATPASTQAAGSP